MKVYTPAIVAELETFYGSLLYSIDKYNSIREHLSAIADQMWNGLESKLPVVFSEINNYNYSYLGIKIEVCVT